MTRFKTIDQGKYWEVHDWERGVCVATAIPDQDMAEAMAKALNGSPTADRDRLQADNNKLRTLVNWVTDRQERYYGKATDLHIEMLDWPKMLKILEVE